MTDSATTPNTSMTQVRKVRRRDFSSGLSLRNSTSSPPNATVFTASRTCTNPPSAAGKMTVPSGGLYSGSTTSSLPVAAASSELGDGDRPGGNSSSTADFRLTSLSTCVEGPTLTPGGKSSETSIEFASAVTGSGRFAGETLLTGDGPISAAPGGNSAETSVVGRSVVTGSGRESCRSGGVEATGFDGEGGGDEGTGVLVGVAGAAGVVV
jgi:hypothetical protein